LWRNSCDSTVTTASAIVGKSAIEERRRPTTKTAFERPCLVMRFVSANG
jgi:hypothetical protein